MSIKIYDGLRAAQSADPFVVAAQIRAVLEPAFFAELDLALDTLGEEAPRSLVEITNRIAELDQRRFHTFDPLDLGYRVMLLPGTERPLIMLFGKKDRRWIKKLIDSGVAEDYGYWDNTDPQESLTEDQWEARRLDWGTALCADTVSDPPDELFSATPEQVSLQINYPSPFRIQWHLVNRARELDTKLGARA